MPKVITGATGAFTVFANNHELSNVTSFSLPEYEFSTSEVSGAGIMGTFNLPTPGQVGAATASVSMRTAGTDKKYLLATTVSLEVRLAANMRASDGTLYVAGTRFYIVGYPTKNSNGNVEVNNSRDETVEYSVVRYREVVDGEEVLLIDQIANVDKLGGVDRMSSVRQILS